jgi:hypothetical protein
MSNEVDIRDADGDRRRSSSTKTITSAQRRRDLDVSKEAQVVGLGVVDGPTASPRTSTAANPLPTVTRQAPETSPPAARTAV